MQTRTKTEALEALLNDALSLLEAAEMIREELQTGTRPVTPESVSSYAANVETFSEKYSALWDRCEAVGRGDYRAAL